MGALIGGGTSLSVALYAQRYQDRLQRVAQELTKREIAYTAFIMIATNCLLPAYTGGRDKISLHVDEQRLIGLVDRIGPFTPAEVVREAEATLKAIIEVMLQPQLSLGNLAREVLETFGQSPRPRQETEPWTS